MTPNIIAWLALGSWPMVAFIFYTIRRSRCRVARTTAWMLFLPVMFLPSSLSIKVQGIPAVDKYRLSILSIALALQLFHRKNILSRDRWHRFPLFVYLVLVTGVFMTMRTNGDALSFGPLVLPGLTVYDFLSISVSLYLDFYLPFAIGQKVFKTEQDVRDLFEVLSLCVLIYLPFCLVELRMSPQLHNWVYGYHPHSFIQAVRGTGYRPVVFMRHGLAVAAFVFSGFYASMALYAARERDPRMALRLRMLLFAALVLFCKSMASIVFSLAGTVLQVFRSKRALSGIIIFTVCVVIIYPVTRASDAFPTNELVNFFARISLERAGSLEFRFRQEDALLERAMRRPLYGWGTWGRSRIYDVASGQDLSVTDGEWILMLGSFGFVGFGVFFAMYIIPLLRYVRNQSRLVPAAQTFTGVLAFLVVTGTVNLLPNTSPDSLPLVYAGALFTQSGRIISLARKTGSRLTRKIQPPQCSG